jgi:hypothetical protein
MINRLLAILIAVFLTIVGTIIAITLIQIKEGLPTEIVFVLGLIWGIAIFKIPPDPHVKMVNWRGSIDPLIMQRVNMMYADDKSLGEIEEVLSKDGYDEKTLRIVHISIARTNMDRQIPQVFFVVSSLIFAYQAIQYFSAIGWI